MLFDTATNKALIAELFEAVNQNDFAPLDPHPGFYETRTYVPPMHALFADWRTTQLQQIAEDELVFSALSLDQIHCGPFAGLAPTGKRVQLTVLSIDQIRDGIVVEHNSASTGPAILRQLDAPAFRSWPLHHPHILAQSPETVSPATLRANKVAVLKLFDALSRGAFTAAATHPGLHDLVDSFVELRRAFPDLTLTPVVQIAEGALVGARATLRGTHLGALYGFPATGRSVSWDFFSIAQIADGVVVTQQSLADWNVALAQLGLME